MGLYRIREVKVGKEKSCLPGKSLYDGESTRRGRRSVSTVGVYLGHSSTHSLHCTGHRENGCARNGVQCDGVVVDLSYRLLKNAEGAQGERTAPGWPREGRHIGVQNDISDEGGVRHSGCIG